MSNNLKLVSALLAMVVAIFFAINTCKRPTPGVEATKLVIDTVIVTKRDTSIIYKPIIKYHHLIDSITKVEYVKVPGPVRDSLITKIVFRDTIQTIYSDIFADVSQDSSGNYVSVYNIVDKKPKDFKWIGIVRPSYHFQQQLPGLSMGIGLNFNHSIVTYDFDLINNIHSLQYGLKF